MIKLNPEIEKFYLQRYKKIIFLEKYEMYVALYNASTYKSIATTNGANMLYWFDEKWIEEKDMLKIINMKAFI